MNQHWFAIRVRPQHEVSTASVLEAWGYEVFSPTYLRRSVWSDRTKTLRAPLFPGYLFCRFDLSQRSQLLSWGGVLYIVGIGRTPHPIDDDELQAVRTLAASDALIAPHKYLRTGDYVRIRSGAFAGVEGILVRVKNEQRLVVSVTLLQRSVSVELGTVDVEPLKPSLASGIIEPCSVV
jgi:transcription termination/antitermination protein NusG